MMAPHVANKWKRRENLTRLYDRAMQRVIEQTRREREMEAGRILDTATNTKET